VIHHLLVTYRILTVGNDSSVKQLADLKLQKKNRKKAKKTQVIPG